MSEKKVIAVIGATGAQGGGLVRAVLADPGGGYAVRAITRDAGSEKARALAAAGAEVVAADTDRPETLAAAFAGAHGVFCVTNYWEHYSPDREGAQATAVARATKAAGVKHVVWSTLEDTRGVLALDDPSVPTLQGAYKVPHFDSKGQVDRVFASEAAPTSYLLAAFYWDNFVHFGMGPRAGENGELVLAMPLGGAKLPGIAAGDIGACAYGIFKRGPAAAGQRFGVSGEVLSGEGMAAAMGRALGRTVRFVDVPFAAYRALGFPGADDLGNMFEYQARRGESFLRDRDPAVARSLAPSVLGFDAWLAANASRIPIA